MENSISHFSSFQINPLMFTSFVMHFSSSQWAICVYLMDPLQYCSFIFSNPLLLWSPMLPCCFQTVECVQISQLHFYHEIVPTASVISASLLERGVQLTIFPQVVMENLNYHV